ncbi:MAG: polysaccharide biosynthesis tyrosine autokinase [Pseudomonadota bacterium]
MEAEPYLFHGGARLIDAEPSALAVWLAALASRRWLVLSILAVGLSVTAAMTLQAPKLYRAAATIEIQTERAQIVDGAGLEPEITADADFMATQYELLRSRALAERVALTLGLAKEVAYADQTAARAARLAQATKTLTQNLEIDPVGRSRMVDIGYVSGSAAEAARIANAYADAFVAENLERKFNTSAYARAFLEQRLAEAETALQASERRLVDYAQANDIIDVAAGADGPASLDAAALISLSETLTQAETDRRLAEARYRAAAADPEAPGALVGETLTRLQTLRAEAQSEYDQKLKTFKPSWPDMQVLQVRLNALDHEIALEKTAALAGLRRAYEAASAQEASLQDRVARLRRDVQDLRERRIQYTILEREVETNRSQYDGLLQRLKEVGVASGLESGLAAIIDPAIAPQAPYSPNLRTSFARGGLISLAAGFLIALLLHRLDDRIKTPADAIDKLNLPLLSATPRLSRRRLARAAADPSSSLSEAIQSARAALDLTAQTNDARCLLVTSARQGEGKSSTATALARSFAASGRKTLLIDADLRRPSALRRERASIGFAGLLETDAAFDDEILATDLAELFLLPSGARKRPSPVQLSAPRLARRIAEARERFDIIVVDAPAVLALADAPLLAGVCGEVVFVTQAGGARRREIQRALDRLTAARADIVGVVLSKLDPRRADFEYRYKYDPRPAPGPLTAPLAIADARKT